MNKRHRASALLLSVLLLGLGGCATPGGGQSEHQRAVAAASKAMSQSDLRLLADLAQTNIAEIQTGQLAITRTQDAQVKAFAQAIVDEHGRALQQLQALATSAGLLLPEGADLVHRAVAAEISPLSGPEFDHRYLYLFGIADHKSLLGLLDQTARTAANPALRSYAQTWLPIAMRHLERAQQLSATRQ